MPDHPTVTHETVYHVGNLDKGREKPRVSYEGDGLSVSQCPRDWARIMRGGGTIYELTRTDGASFFDAAVEDKPQDGVRDWCIQHNYVKNTPLFRVEWHDPEIGEQRHMLFYDEETAKAEAEARMGTVQETTGLDLDTNGIKYWKCAFRQDPSNASPLLIRDLLPVWFAENHGYQGVWWNERHDPTNHSAPRGVIFQPHLGAWTRDEVGSV